VTSALAPSGACALRSPKMHIKPKIPGKAIAALVGFACSLSSLGEENKERQFPSIGERRMNLVGKKIESLGCTLDKEAILKAKDGETLVFKHMKDPKGDVTVEFNHMILPKGNWILYGAKNATTGTKSEDVPENYPVRMEAVSAVLSGRAINASPRDIEDRSTYREVYVDVRRSWGWDIVVAHSWTTRSAVHSFGYYVPEISEVARKDFKEHQLPIVNILHLDEKKTLKAGGLFWFEQQGEQAGTGQPATRPESKSEGSDKPQPESEGRCR
jgi:hypothetical protein